MRITIAYSKIEKAKTSVGYKDAYQRETLTKWPVWLPFWIAGKGQNRSRVETLNERLQSRYSISNNWLVTHQSS